MDLQSISAIVFIILLGLFLYFQRKKLELQKIFFPILYFLMYRSKIGLRFMDGTAKKYPRVLRRAAVAGIILGFLGMILIAGSLIHNMIKLLTEPAAVSGVQLVLPVRIKGSFFVPFFYWIISIMIIALVHEFSHGIVARAYNMKIKSSGFAFLGILVPILPAAFVEPDEKELRKRPRIQQLSVFAAGPISNVMLGFMVLALLLVVIGPVTAALFSNTGVEITGLIESETPYPAEAAGIRAGETVTALGDTAVEDLQTFTKLLKTRKPGDSVVVSTDKNSYTLTLAENPDNSSQAYLGVYVQQKSELRPSVGDSIGTFLPSVIIWIVGLLYWLYLLNLGIGLFNLVPLGPIDGGRMLLTALQKYFDEEKAQRYWRLVSAFFLCLIVANIAFAFLR